MIIKAKVKSTNKNKGITELVILTNEIKDNIDWVGEIVYIKKPEFEVKEIKEEL